MTPRAPDPARPASVLFLVPSLVAGGAERQLAELVTRMDRSRFLPVVVCQKEGGPFFAPIEEAGIPTYKLEMHGKLDPRFPWRLAALCRRHDVRALVIRGFSTAVVGRLVAGLLRLPVIMAEHSTGTQDPDPKKPPIEKLMGRWTDGVIAVAKGQVPYLVREKSFAERIIRVIYNGIELSEWTPAPRDSGLLTELDIAPDAPVAGILAMLRPEKDHDTFLAAAKLARERVPDALFLIVGDGEERPRLERRAAELGLERCVRFTGVRKDVARMLTVFDVSVLCSVTVETFPMSFLEAMAMERPLIATRVGGVPEMIEEGENGWVVPLRDPQTLADAMVRILSDRERARRMGKRSREIVEERFTMDRMVRETEAYLESFVR